MADVVENRVVEMQFDNKDFEQGVSTSLSTLDKLKEALQFNNASKGFQEIQNSIRKIDFSPIENSLQSLESGFMTLAGSLKRNFFDEISNSVLNLGQQLYQNTIGQIKSGGQRRAMNIEQAKFKISGLGEDWDTVYKDMDYAVSGTAYGIDQAANAASQFLASGVKAGDNMKAALRGISGIAAMTSADYDEIANIFTAAAGKGKVQAMELNRISQRGVNAAAAIAQQLGTTEEAVRDMASKGTLDFNTFANAMDAAFGEHAKKANETFTGSMSNMKAALSRIGEIFYAPYLENMIPVFNRLRETIDKFKNAMKEEKNSDKESVASRIADLYKALSNLFLKWADTWEPALARLPKRMDKWFEALGYITKKIEKFQDILGDVAEGVKSVTKAAGVDLSKLTEQEEQAARDIWNIGNWGNGEERRKNLEAAGMSYERVQAVVNQIVEGSYKWDKWLYKAAGVSEDSAEAYDIHSWAVQTIVNAYNTLTSVVNTVQLVMQKLFKIVRAGWVTFITVWKDLGQAAGDVKGPFTELVTTVKSFMKNFKIAGTRTEYLKSTFKGLFAILKLGSYIAASFFKAMRIIFDQVGRGHPVLLQFTGDIGEMVYNFVEAVIKGGKIPAIMSKIADAIKVVIEKIQGLSEKGGIKGIFTNIIEHVKNVISTIKKLFTGETTISEVFKNIVTKLKTFISELTGMDGEVEQPLSDILEKVTTFVTSILDVVGKTLFGSDFSFADWLRGIFSKEDTEGETESSKGIIPTLSEKISTLGEQLSGLWDNMKKFFSDISGGIKTVWEHVKKHVEEISNLFTSIFKFVTRMFDLGTANADGMQENFQAFADFVSTCFIVAREIVWSIKDPLKDIVKAVTDMIAGIANMFAGITNWIGNDPENAYGAAAFFSLLKIIEKIMDYKLIQQKGSKDSVLYSIATFFDDMRSAVDMWQKEHLERVLDAIATAVIKIAIAIGVLIAVMSGAAIGTSSAAAQEAALQSFLYLTAFMWEIFGILALTKNIFSSNTIDLSFVTIAFKSIALTMLLISAGLGIVMSSAQGLTGGQIAIIMTFMFLIIAEVFGGIAALVYMVDNINVDEKKMSTVTAFTLAFAKAIKQVMKGISYLMAVVITMIEIQGGDKAAWENSCKLLIIAVSAAAGLMIALGGAFAIMFTTGKNMPDPKNMAMLAVLLIVYTGCVKSIMLALVMLMGVLEFSDSDTLFAGMTFMIIIMGVLAAMVAGAVALVNHAKNPSELMTGLAGIAMVVMVVGECIKSIAMAAAMLALAGVTSSQMESVVMIVGIIGALVIALSAIGMIGGAAAGTGLLAFAGGILMIAAAIYVINAAIYTICKAIVMLIGTFIALATVWPQISGNVPKMLEDLEVQLPKFIELIGNCIVQLAKIVIKAAPLIGEAIAVVIATVINASWGYIPKVVANFLAMVDAVLDLLIDGATTILPKLLLLLLMLIEYLDANAIALGYLLANVLMKVIWGALMAIGDFLMDTVFPWLVKKIGDVVANGKDQIVDAITDAALGDWESEVNDEIVLRDTTEVNSVTGTHFRYYNPKTDKYYDTLEEAQNAEIDEQLEANREKAQKATELKGQTIDTQVELNTEYVEKAKGVGSFKDTDKYKEFTDNTELKESASGVFGDLKNLATEKLGIGKKEAEKVGVETGKATAEGYSEGVTSAVSQEAYIEGLKKQGTKAGKESGKATAEAQTASYEQYMGNIDMSKYAQEYAIASPEIDMSNMNTDEIQKQFSNMDEFSDLDYNGVVNADIQYDENGVPLNDVYNGSTKIGLDSSGYNEALQQNTDTQKEQISMLDKVKSALDDLKANLKDCVIVPKGANIDITTTIDKQKLGKTMTPIVSAIQDEQYQQSSQNMATSRR